MLVCFFTTQVNITFMVNCYDFAVVWAKGNLQNVSLVYKYVQKKFIFSTHENVFYRS